MSRTTRESTLIRLRDTRSVRRWMKSTLAKRIRSSRAGEIADAWMLRRRALSQGPGGEMSLDMVTTACLVIGHVKSGGSLLGAMLDAHPEIVMGDEVDLARLMRAKIPAEAMLAEFARSARREEMKGRVTARRLGGYSLAIGGWSQGSSVRPLVVGNSRAGPTTRYLADVPGALSAVIDVFGERRLVFLHVIRRPEDSVAAMVLRSGRDIIEAARDYARQCQRLATLHAQLGESVHPIHYESLLEECHGTLEGVLDFLDVIPPDGFLAACSDLLDHGLVPESDRVTWNTASLRIIEETVHGFEFLSPYRD